MHGVTCQSDETVYLLDSEAAVVAMQKCSVLALIHVGNFRYGKKNQEHTNSI